MKTSVFLLILGLSLPSYAQECVVLLHGLVRSSSSMEKLEEKLISEGYAVANIDYPSRKHRIEHLAKTAVENGLDQCKKQQASKIHFVTHSLGGILVRYYLSINTIENLGRTVMLGPPNGGSEVVDKLQHIPGFEFINGPAGLQLGTGAQSIPSSLGAANFEVGIIAGTRSINLILSALIPSQDDGKVSIKNAHLDNEKAFISMPVSHPFIMKNDAVISNVINFLKFGKFNQPKDNATD
jgi:Palmitoyl protein thioesterase